MFSTRRFTSSAPIVILLLLTTATVVFGQQVLFKPLHPNGIYKVGDKVGWTITLTPGNPRSTPYQYKIRKNNQELMKSGTLDFSTGPASVDVIADEPAMIYLEVTPPTPPSKPDARPLAAGAAVEPEKLLPSSPRPEDFDKFWLSKINALKGVPENPVLTPGDSGKPGVEYATIKMDNFNGTHVYGQIAKPARPGKFPALLILQWASPPYPLQKPWVTDRAAEGWLTLNIEPHDVLPTEPAAYYAALPAEIKKYNEIGRSDRDKNYFLQMYLADYRAVDYLANRPDWDGKTLVVMGTSMGGQQSLSVAGLNPKITHMIVNEPAGSDTTGPLHGRASGYPFWPVNDPQILQTSRYFDPINFATNITARSMVAMGFVDPIAPPVGIWIAFNQIKGPKEPVPMIDSPHNNSATVAEQFPYTNRSAEWLDALVNGREITAVIEPADKPVPRFDQNSQFAHTQLVQKAKTGKVDVYFEGDSITRRWGAGDAQYANMFANWRQNFFGWNAGDFGWGGDTTQNILWRLNNGELDGVDPKVIVLMAGTNNVGRMDARPNDPRVEDITKGIQAILKKFQAKAPNATIVLMGITPRNDNMAVMPIITAINANLAKLADGTKIRFVNINDKLADKDGKLLEGMTLPDKLHLEVKGYQVWADAIKPILTELLGPPAKDDQAPPPTSDPSAPVAAATK